MTTMGSIRAVRPGNGQGIATAWVDCGRHYAELDPDLFKVPSADDLPSWFEAALLVGPEAATCRLVADMAGEAVGCLLASLQPGATRPDVEFNLSRMNRRVWVDLLIVPEAVRGLGVGSALLGAAEAWARERDATAIELDTFERSPLSLPFYEHRGYGRRAVRLQKSLA